MVDPNHPSPFKFKLQWLEDKSFNKLEKEELVPFVAEKRESISLQFVTNIKKLKGKINH